MAFHAATSDNNFPSELVSPQEKSSKEYGSQLARAIFFNSSTSSHSLWYNERGVHREQIRYALGDQDPTKYKQFLGVNSNNVNENMLGSIIWNIRPYAFKRIQSAIAKVVNRKYDPVVNAIDPRANQFKKDYKGRLKAYLRNKPWLTELGEEMSEEFMPEGFDIGSIPTNDEEIEIHMQQSAKLRSEIELEQGIAYHLERNNYTQIRDHLNFDFVSQGLVAIWVGMDENMNPQVFRYRPEDVLAPYSELPDFSNINYVGTIRRMTISELRKLAGDEFTETEYKDIEENYANATDRETNQGIYDKNDTYTGRQDTRKIRVMHFEWMTTDELVHKHTTDTSGNARIHEKKWSWKRNSPEEDNEEDKKSKRTVARYKTVYSGYSIIGAEDKKYVFKYGRKKNEIRNRGNLGETMLGYKLFAPNMYDGKVVSPTQQMMPILDNLQQYSLKLQHAIARAVPKGIIIDFHKLAQVKFHGDNKAAMTPKEVIDFYFQTGILMMDGSTNYAPGVNNRPIEELMNGMSDDVVRYDQLINSDLAKLDEIVGLNPAAHGSQLHPDTGKAVAEMQIQSSNTAIDYLFRADAFVFNEVCKTLGLLHIQSVKYGEEDRYANIFGASSVRWIINDSGILEHDFGFAVKPRPDAEEWETLYQALQVAMERGEIDSTALVTIRDTDNLKEAKSYLKYAVAKSRRERMQESTQASQENAMFQQQSNQQAHDNAMALEQTKQSTMTLEHQFKMKELEREYQLKTQMELQIQVLRNEGKMEETTELTRSKEDQELLKAHVQSEKNQQQVTK